MVVSPSRGVLYSNEGCKVSNGAIGYSAWFAAMLDSFY